MEGLLRGVSNHHDVDLGVVREYVSRRNLLADSAVIGAFGVLYMPIAFIAAGKIVRRFPCYYIRARHPPTTT
jgi:hypothetical protein